MEKTPVSKRSFNIKNLFLDPNNYRFIDEKEYSQVDREKILNERIQKKTRYFIEGEKRSNIIDLIHSFKANGYIPVEKIQVKDLGENRYLVLEGNRRTAALKALQEDYELGRDIGQLDPALFRRVDVEVHDEENEHIHLLVMGLKHIGGNKKWPAVNQAKFIKDYIDKFEGEYWEAENSACETLSISKQKLRLSLRALELIEQYKHSDYGDQFENEQYAIFEEIVRTPIMREWIDWNDDDYQAENSIHLERLFNWISTVEAGDDEEKAPHKAEPIITKSAEIRELKIFINEENALEIMEKNRSFTQGLLNSSSREKINIQETVNTTKRNIDLLYTYRNAFDVDVKKELEEMFSTFSKVVPQKASINLEGEYKSSVCFEMATAGHFSQITIQSYKIFHDFQITNLNKINLFGGLNNTGKTSLLEAIYLLTKQNDLNAFFEIVRLKNKLEVLSPLWLSQFLETSPIVIQGMYNGVETGLSIRKEEAKNIDKADYITSIVIDAFIDDETHSMTKAHLYRYAPIQLYYDTIKILSHSMFKSPFFHKESDILLSYSKNYEKKLMPLIIDFLKKVDSQINDIGLVEVEGIKRFLVDSSRYTDHKVDITSYGEGLQRIFEISLAFAYAKNGVILIDELETGIHHSLLIDFTRFIQELAERFNVQVFITSHSKECLNAFVQNGSDNESISAYILQNKGEKVTYHYSEGEKFSRLVEAMDIDMRGEK